MLFIYKLSEKCVEGRLPVVIQYHLLFDYKGNIKIARKTNTFQAKVKQSTPDIAEKNMWDNLGKYIILL